MLNFWSQPNLPTQMNRFSRMLPIAGSGVNGIDFAMVINFLHLVSNIFCGIDPSTQIGVVGTIIKKQN